MPDPTEVQAALDGLARLGLAPVCMSIPSAKVGRWLVCYYVVDAHRVMQSYVLGHVERPAPRRWRAWSPKADLVKPAGAPFTDDDFDVQDFPRQQDAEGWLLARFQGRLEPLMAAVGGPDA
jgi:hypothetical protein